MPVRSLELALGYVAAANTPTIIYTVPSGRTTVWRSSQFLNDSGSAGTGWVFVRRGATDIYLHRLVLATVQERTIELWRVLEPGDGIGLLWSAANTLAYHLSGAQLVGVV